MVALGLWGLGGLDLPVDERIDPRTARAELIALALAGTQTTLLDPTRRDAFEFHVGDEVFHLHLRDGQFVARSGASPSAPVVSVACDLQTFIDLALRTLVPSEAVEDGRVRVLAGSGRAFTELYDVLVFVPHAPVPSSG